MVHFPLPYITIVSLPEGNPLISGIFMGCVVHTFFCENLWIAFVTNGSSWNGLWFLVGITQGGYSLATSDEVQFKWS